MAAAAAGIEAASPAATAAAVQEPRPAEEAAADQEADQHLEEALPLPEI